MSNYPEQISARAASPAQITSAPPQSAVPQYRAPQPQVQPPAAPNGDISQVNAVFDGRRDILAERLTVMMLDFGGLAYEMAIRNHVQVDVLVKRAAVLQEADAELSEVERIVRMEESGTAGSCTSCGAPHSSGATFCWQCGQPLLEQVSGEAILRR
jgi:hypothetical protein